MFNWKRGLVEHEKNFHGHFLYRYECPECSVTFSTPYLRKYHLNKKHNYNIDAYDATKYIKVIRNSKKGKKM